MVLLFNGCVKKSNSSSRVSDDATVEEGETRRLPASALVLSETTAEGFKLANCPVQFQRGGGARSGGASVRRNDERRFKPRYSRKPPT